MRTSGTAGRPTRPGAHRARRRRAAGHGALGLLAALFLASGGLRLSDGTGTELRQGLWAFAASDPGQTAAPADDEAGDDPAGTRAPEAMLVALSDREAALDRRAADLTERERALRLAEEKLAEKLEALAEAERRLRETIALADGAAAADLERLTRMYERMKPKEAAALFETMDPNFAAGFLGQMRPDAAAEILAGLSPQKAYTVSLVLAGRNMDVPTE